MHIIYTDNSQIKLRKSGMELIYNIRFGSLLFVAFIVFSLTRSESSSEILTKGSSRQILFGLLLIFILGWLFKLAKAIHATWFVTHIVDRKEQSYCRNDSHIVDLAEVKSVELLAIYQRQGKGSGYTQYIVQLVVNPEEIYEVMRSRHEGNLAHIAASIAHVIGCPIRIEQFQ